MSDLDPSNLLDLSALSVNNDEEDFSDLSEQDESEELSNDEDDLGSISDGSSSYGFNDNDVFFTREQYERLQMDSTGNDVSELGIILF